MKSSINTSFPVIEHLTEGFSVGCLSVCGDPSADPSVRAACDLGSQSYCKTDKISTAECAPYLDRVFATKSGASVAIPIPAGSINTYYADLKQYAISVATADMAALSSTNVSNLITALKAEPSKEMYNAVVDAVIAKCVLSADTTCLSISWITERVTATVKANAISWGISLSTTAILANVQANWNHYLKFVSLYNPIHDLLMKIGISDVLTNTTLIGMREKSPYFQNAIDLFIINSLLKTSSATIPVTAAGNYNVDLSKIPAVYNKMYRSFYLALKNRPNAASDKLVVVFAVADDVNTKRVPTVDPKTDSVCVAMKATGEAAFVKLIDDAIAKAEADAKAARCLLPANVGTTECITYINAMSNISDDTYRLVLQGAIKPDGTMDKAILDKYPGLKPWLLKNTADKIVIDANGNTTIASTCAATTNLTAAQCGQLCAIYPENCTADQVKRCSIPEYRYAKDGFKEMMSDCDDSCDSPIDINWWLVVIFVLIAFVILINRNNLFGSRTMNYDDEESSLSTKRRTQ